ncbi:MAG: branched-chain amino acid ABC transporter substrate-binding protein, partial [Candidatus Methylomirabilales bacterium]
MRRWRWLGMVSAVVAVVIAASTADAQQCPKGTLRIYTSWPFLGIPSPEIMGMRNGVDMAVAEAGGAVAGYCLEVVPLSSASPETGRWDRVIEANNAYAAVADPLAVVYIGPFNSGATRISLPITNRSSMAQLGPSDTYPGLTREGTGTAQGEPWMYRPRALVNFFRLAIPADVQGEAAARRAKRLGVKKVFVLHDGGLYGKGVA